MKLKPTHLLILIIAHSLLLVTNAIAAPYIQDGGSDGLVSIEAENFDLHTPQGDHQWQRISPAGASGDAMEAAPNSGANRNSNYPSMSPRLDYEIEFVHTGIHYVWVRGYAPSYVDDSLHVGLNGVALSSSDRIMATSVQSWMWSASTMDGVVARIDVTTTGVHTLNVWMREDGFILDKIVLTRDGNDAFSGLGPNESPREPGDPGADNDGDGFTQSQGDCNDSDDSVYPGAVDICGDGIDQDCSGADLDCPVDPDDIDDDGDGFSENQGDCNDSDDEIYPGATEICGDGIDNDCTGGDESCGGSNTISCAPTCDLCPPGDDSCDLPVDSIITIVSTKAPTWRLDFGVGQGDDEPVRVGGGVAHNLRIPSTATNSIDGPGQDSCCNGLGLDNHEWRWKIRSVPNQCDGNPPDEVNVSGKGTRADIGMKTISATYSLIEQTSTRIVFTIEGTVRTTVSSEVRNCPALGYTHTYEYSDFRRTTTVTPDGYTVDMEVDYRGTEDEDSMWWTIAQLKNAEEPGEFNQGILPSQVTVTDGNKVLPLNYTPHSPRYLGWVCDSGPGCANEYPNGQIDIPYTIIFPLNSPSNHDIQFSIDRYAVNPFGGTPDLYEYWHKDGDGAPGSIGDYSVVYPRWSSVWGTGFHETTYEFEWSWRFTP